MKYQKGYIAITTVLVLMVVGMSIATTAAFLGIGGVQGSYAQTKGEETLAFVEGCMEDALLKTWTNASYAGGTIVRPEGTCIVTVNSKVGNVWTMTVSTAETDYIRTVRVIFTRGTYITLTSWQEQ